MLEGNIHLEWNRNNATHFGGIEDIGRMRL